MRYLYHPVNRKVNHEILTLSSFIASSTARNSSFGDDLDRSSQLVFARFLDHGRTSSCPQRNHSTHSTIYAKSKKMDLYSIFNCTVFPALGRVGSRDT